MENLFHEMNVSRETTGKLEKFSKLVTKWNPKINLISKSTLSSIDHRHMLDSAQVSKHSNQPTGLWLDMGSGGGFPGIVVAILGEQFTPEKTFKLVESDTRKATFLRTAIRDLEIDASVENARLEDLPKQNATTVTARALAPLPLLLSYVHRHIAPTGEALLHKGKTWKTEVDLARKHWHFDIETFQSLTETDSVILRIRNLEHV